MEALRKTSADTRLVIAYYTLKPSTAKMPKVALV